MHIHIHMHVHLHLCTHLHLHLHVLLHLHLTYTYTYIDTCNICRPVYHESPEQGFWLGLLSQPSEASHRSSFLKSQGVDLGRLGRRSRVWDLGFGAIGLDLDLDLELWFAGSWAEFEERERERDSERGREPSCWMPSLTTGVRLCSLSP